MKIDGFVLVFKEDSNQPIPLCQLGMAIWFFTESVAYQEAEKLSKRHGKEVISRPATITIEVKE